MEPTIAELVLGRTLLGYSMGDIGRYGLVLIMLTMGMHLRLQDFQQLVRQPVSVVTGLTGQILFLPAVAFLLIWLLQPELHIAIGAIVLSCCPGAATSNYFSYLARGDVALSVTLTAISGTLVVVTLPLLVNLGFLLLAGSEQQIRLPVVETMQQIFLLLILPVITGMSLKALLPSAIGENIQRLLSGFSFAVMMLVVVMSLSGLWGRFGELVAACGLLALLTNVITMGGGYAAGSVVGLAEEKRRCLTVEIGIQNFLLAMVIALTILQNPDYAVFPVMYLVMMYISVFLFIGWCRLWRDRALPDQEGIV
jgi:BASS family bile acid:Na+ symporter